MLLVKNGRRVMDIAMACGFRSKTHCLTTCRSNPGRLTLVQRARTG